MTKNFFKTVCLVGGTLVASSAFAAPAQILILRHGEKPLSGNTLSAQGYQRAEADGVFVLSRRSLRLLSIYT